MPRTDASIDCRSGCGACCIAPSISSPIPGMPNGKQWPPPNVQQMTMRAVWRQSFPSTTQQGRFHLHDSPSD